MKPETVRPGQYRMFFDRCRAPSIEGGGRVVQDKNRGWGLRGLGPAGPPRAAHLYLVPHLGQNDALTSIALPQVGQWPVASAWDAICGGIGIG